MFCSELRLTTLAGGEKGLLTPERGVGGTDGSGVRKGSRRNSSEVKRGCGGCRGRCLLEPIVVVDIDGVAAGWCCTGVDAADSCSKDDAAELAVEGGERWDMV